ncbi:MAG TPA: GDSL-type esterase/lipase family protein [Verrucomicrobiae bacterium]|nr:GDSL-type esterase/lipase family protein [Verrucomicrobiae bacterium]
MKRLFLTLAIAVVLAVPAVPAIAQTSASPGATTNRLTGRLRCITPLQRDGKHYQRFLLLNERAKAAGSKAELIFVGDSITERWEGDGKNVWAKYYQHRNALNLGIGGDRTEHVLWRLDHGNIDGLHPKVAVLLIGVNNIPDESNSPGDVLAGIKAIVQRLRTGLPETKILVLGIFPFRPDFSPQRGRALQINQALSHIADNKNVFFLDFGERFITADGKITKAIMRDALHPTEAGYRIWAEAMEPKLSELLGDEPVRP